MVVQQDKIKLVSYGYSIAAQEYAACYLIKLKGIDLVVSEILTHVGEACLLIAIDIFLDLLNLLSAPIHGFSDIFPQGQLRVQSR